MAVNDYLKKSSSYKGFHYSELKPDMLNYLHKRTLEMLKEIIKVFKANNISYMIVGGTLLGAVTQKKFIPWDDDLDVCIFEEDYERAQKCLINSLPDGMMLQCRDTEPHYYLGWVKVRDCYSSVYPGIPSFKNNGVWVDIYKLVPAKEHDVKRIIEQENLDYLHRRYSVGGFTEKEYCDRIHKLNEESEANKPSEEINSSNNEVYIIWSASKKTIRKEWVFPITEYDFEGIKVTSIHNCDLYLREHYGDQYMIMPDDEFRRVGIKKVEYPENEK